MSVSLICRSADRDDDGFDLIQPSLIQQLRSILDQYPDDGQILKVRHITFMQISEIAGKYIFTLYLLQ